MALEAKEVRVCFKQVFVALGFGASVLFVRRDTTVGEKEKQLFSD